LTGDLVIAAVEAAEANTRRFAEAGGRGVVLRFGRFYDASSNYSRPQVRAASLGLSGELGTPDGYQPLIDVRDAATGVALALSTPTGTYNVVDDDPLTRRQIDDVLAHAVGRKRLHRVLDRMANGPAAEAFSRSIRASNARFKAVTGWRPTPGGTTAGLQRLVRETGYGDRGLNGWMRLLLWVLAISGLGVGIQALFTPQYFYDEFPFGRGWVAMDPPFNEHLIRDVGAFNLALAAITLVAIAIRSPLATRLAGLGWLVFSIPHAWYHLAHLHGFDTADAVGVAFGTAGPAVVALLVLVLPTAAPRAFELVAPMSPTRKEPSLSVEG
jgi:hypothetical protein